MLSLDFSDQVVIVTGGTKGIGRTICERFLGLGANVLTCGRTEPAELPTAGGRTAAFLACDVRDPDQVDALVAALRAVTPPSSLAPDWPHTVDGLALYAGWARTIATKVAKDGLKVDQTPPPGLEAFRGLMPYGACHDLLDVN